MFSLANINNGINDVANLFSRVSALEQADTETDETLVSIAKGYATIGISVKMTYKIHQYKICGAASPVVSPTLII